MYFYCMCRLIFIKLYDSGYLMFIVVKGFLFGEELLRYFFFGGKKKKVYFLFEELGMIVGFVFCYDCFFISVCKEIYFIYFNYFF